MKTKTLVLLLLGWRITLFIVGSLAARFLEYKPSFPYAEAILLNRNLPIWLASWANFDGVHYLTIIEKGYVGTGLIQAFFPLYSLVVAAVSFIPIDPLVLGLLLSNLAFMAFAITFYRYVNQNYSTKIANWSLVSLLLFPTAFFLGAFYTESLFLLVVIASLWSAQAKKWWLASLFAGLAAATRLVGIFLIPALLLELLQQNMASNKSLRTQLYSTQFYIQFFKKNLKQIMIILLSSLGLLSYMAYLQLNFNDPLYFFHVQSEFGGGRQESLVVLPQVVWRYLKIFITYRPFDLKYFVFVQEFVFTTLAYLGVLLAAKKVRWSWTIFSLFAITLPTLTGTFSSMPRYVLVALPLFVLAGTYLSKKSKIWLFFLVASGLLLLCNTILFIQGYWVA